MIMDRGTYKAERPSADRWTRFTGTTAGIGRMALDSVHSFLSALP